MKQGFRFNTKCLAAFILAGFIFSDAYGQLVPANNNFNYAGSNNPISSPTKMISVVPSSTPAFTFSYVSPLSTTGSVIFLGQSQGLFRLSDNAIFFNYTTGGVIPGAAGGVTGTGDYRLHFTQDNPSDTGANKLGNFGMSSMYIAIGSGKTANVVIQGFRGGTQVASATITGLSSSNGSLSSSSSTDLTYSGSDAFSGVNVVFGTNWQFLDGLTFTINDRTIPLSIDDIIFNSPTDFSPGLQSSSIGFTNTTGVSSQINWTPGGGDSVAVFVATSGSSATLPATHTFYKSHTTFGSGDQISSTGWYCIYRGKDGVASPSASVYGLTPGTAYKGMVISYNGALGWENYHTTATSNVNSFTTIAIPATQASNIVVTPDYTDFKKATISWTNGSGAKRAVFVRNNTSTPDPTVAPLNNNRNADAQHFTYTAFTDSSLIPSSSPARVGSSGWYCVYNDIGTSVPMSKITNAPGQTLRVMVVEYNGTAGSETYNTTSASNNVADYFNPNYPLPVTDPATGITSSGATLNGNIDPRNANITNGSFVYSLNSSLSTILGTITTLTPAATSITGSASATTVAGSLTGLLPSTTYYYRLSATSNAGVLTATNNTGGATNGIRSFTTVPVVSSVSATTANGSYKAGQVIVVTVAFTSAVTVTGTPTITLNSGSTASYGSGSGTATLTFNYTVAGGENSADLDYTSTSALTLSGGTIKDANNNNALLTLPTVGGASSLGGQKNIVIDTQVPGLGTVTIVSNNANPSLAKSGDVITLAFTASETIGIPSVTIASHTITPTNTSANNWTATYTMVSSDASGTVAFNIAFSDIAANAGTAVTATTNSSSISFDKTIPSLTPVTIVSNNANTALAKVGDLVTLGFTSSETIVLPTITIAGHTAAVTNTSSNNWSATYTMAGADASGTIPFTVAYQDNAGNAATLTATTNSSSVLFDKTTPTLSSVSIVSNNANTAFAKPGDQVSLLFTSSETIATPTITIAGNTAAVTNTGNNWTATYTVTGTATAGVVPFSISFNDLAGNAATTSATTNSSSVTFDKTAPVLSPVTIASNNSNTAVAKPGDVVTITFIAAETILTPVVTIAGNPATTSNTGNNWMAVYTMMAADAAGTIVFNISFSDAAGNAGTAVTATTNSSSVVFDKTLPTLISTTIVSDNATNTRAKTGDKVTLSFTAGETIASPAVTIAGVPVTAVNTTGNNWTAAYTLTANNTEGVIPFSIAFSDQAGNAGTAVSAATDNSSVVFDRTVPSVTSISLVNASPTGAVSVQYLVTFSEPVTGMDATDLALNAGVITGASVSSVSGSGNTYTVTVNTGTGNGTLRLDLNNSGTGIADLAGNQLSTGFTAGQVYNVNKNNAPSITVQPAGSSLCAGANTSFSVTVADNSGVTYQWQEDKGGGFTNLANTPPYSNTTTSSLTITAATTALHSYQYRCVVTNTGGSTASDPAVLVVSILPVVGAITGSSAICVGNTAVFTNAVTGGLWTSSDITKATVTAGGVVTAIATGSATISYKVTNAAGCTTTVSSSVGIDPLPGLTITPMLGTVKRGSTIRLTVLAPAGASIAWTPAASLDNPTGFTPLARPLDNTIYTATVTTVGGCKNSISVTILSTEDFISLDAAVIFTPNGDGINDKFVITNIDAYPLNSLQVFTKTGKIVFQATNYHNEWDGSFSGKPLPTDTYFYVLKVKDVIVKKGAINVLGR